MNLNMPKGTPLQWFIFVVAVGLVSYVPVTRFYLFLHDKSWNNMPQDANSTQNTDIIPEH